MCRYQGHPFIGLTGFQHLSLTVNFQHSGIGK